MPLSKAAVRELTALDLPSDAVIQKRVRSFMLKSGLSMNELSGMVGYNISSLSRFLSGSYPGQTHEIRAALKQELDQHEFAEYTRLDRTHYPTKAYLEIRTAALNSLRNGAAYIIDGPPGTEKTESARRVAHEINQGAAKGAPGRAIYVYARVRHAPKAFLSEVCAAAGIPNNGNIDPLLRKLRFFLAKGPNLLMVDEAQHLGHDGLEVLRQLLDLPPFFGVMLFGSHDLTQRLQHWQMEQWRSRVRKSIFLTGPSDVEARQILRAELGEISDAECDQMIADCKSSGERVEMRQGKAVRKQYTYTSARDLFSAIETIQQQLQLVGRPAGQADAQKESAA